MHGLFYPFESFFHNTTIVDIIKPERSNVTIGLNDLETRLLSPYVSWEEKTIRMEYFFGVAYFYDDMNTVSAPLNLPPLYAQYERGRALLGFNTSERNLATPFLKDAYEDVVKGE